MKTRKLKSILLIALGVFATGLMPLAGGCARTTVFIPEVVQLEPPPIMITADQLYVEYVADEAAADTKYKGKEVWVTEATVDSYIESESGNYLVMRGYQFEIEQIGDETTSFEPLFSLSTLKLEPQIAEDFKDVGTGYLVEVVGECQGISEGVVTEDTDEPLDPYAAVLVYMRVIPKVVIVEINWIAITGVALPEAPPEGY